MGYNRGRQNLSASLRSAPPLVKGSWRGAPEGLPAAAEKAPLSGADSPCQGEMSRRDKRGRDAVSRRLTERLSLNSENLRRCAPPWLPFQGSWLGAAETERLSQICMKKPKPQIQFAVWKGRNEHRGKETSLAAARSVVVISDAPPAAPSFPSCRKRRGRKGAFGYVWCVLPLNSGKALVFRRRSTR